MSGFYKNMETGNYDEYRYTENRKTKPQQHRRDYRSDDQRPVSSWEEEDRNPNYED